MNCFSTRMHDGGEVDVRACYTAISVSSDHLGLSACGHGHTCGLVLYECIFVSNAGVNLIHFKSGNRPIGVVVILLALTIRVSSDHLGFSVCGHDIRVD